VKSKKVSFIRPETSRSNYEQAEGFTGGPNSWMLQNSGKIC